MGFSLSSPGLRGKVATAPTAFAMAGMRMRAIMVGDALDQTLIEPIRDLDAAPVGEPRNTSFGGAVVRMPALALALAEDGREEL